MTLDDILLEAEEKMIKTRASGRQRICRGPHRARVRHLVENIVGGGAYGSAKCAFAELANINTPELAQRW